MHFVVVAKDKPDPELRKAARADHIAFIAERQEPVVYAGPLLDQGRIVGSLFIFDLPDRAALDAFLAQDPYAQRGVFATVEIFESRWMVPEREPGSLAAAAERARAG